jgi:hypothetical protein
MEAKMDDTKKRVRRMAVWTIAIFATIFASVLAALWIVIYNSGTTSGAALGKAFGIGWPVLLVDLILCAGVYFGYSFSVSRKK